MRDLPSNSRAIELEGYTTEARENPPVRDLERDWSQAQGEEKLDGGGHREKQIWFL
ncbi:unnamed protein product [Brassica rapa]|uniref:Uncharacterized protein n=1 Tax=Brassica campestris TaxID=3711 RepID=A0A3P5ZM70_BRACM|nr:unnamed protein product [Brassica rapa]VDC76534.1 unnamed protein product [Brassica rapa]